MEQVDACPITRVDRESEEFWFRCIPVDDDDEGPFLQWEFILGRYGRSFVRDNDEADDDRALIDFIHELYNLRIGEVACKRKYNFGPEYQERITYRHAKIKLGDIVDFYTTADGELKVPKWTSFQYAVEEYLENDPRIKFNPSRVQQFIEQRGMENLEEME